MSSRKEGDRVGAVTGGVILVTLGLLFLSGELGIANMVDWWRYWPAILIAVGVAHLVMGGEDRFGNGFTNLFLGLAFLAINFHWLGLGWGSGWPLIIVAIGLGMTLKALLTPRRARKDPSGAAVVEEERHA